MLQWSRPYGCYRGPLLGFGCSIVCCLQYCLPSVLSNTRGLGTPLAHLGPPQEGANYRQDLVQPRGSLWQLFRGIKTSMVQSSGAWWSFTQDWMSLEAPCDPSLKDWQAFSTPQVSPMRPDKPPAGSTDADASFCLWEMGEKASGTSPCCPS